MRLARRSSGALATAELRYRAAQNIAVGHCNDATFLLNKTTGRYYRLDDVGSELWALLRRSPGLTTREIVHELSAVYEVDPQDIADDVAALVAGLIGFAVIEADSSTRRG